MGPPQILAQSSYLYPEVLPVLSCLCYGLFSSFIKRVRGSVYKIWYSHKSNISKVWFILSSLLYRNQHLDNTKTTFTECTRTVPTGIACLLAFWKSLEFTILARLASIHSSNPAVASQALGSQTKERSQVAGVRGRKIADQWGQPGLQSESLSQEKQGKGRRGSASLWLGVCLPQYPHQATPAPRGSNASDLKGLLHLRAHTLSTPN